MKKTILVFAALILALLVLFQLSTYSVVSGNLNIEIIIVVIALVFFFIGMYLNKKRSQQPSVSTEINQKNLQNLDLSKREYEVLQAIALGFSNKEIADQLFVSESTIKTHVSSVLTKLNAKRRTQAIQIAKELQIL
jgi:DNA-binding NarL/FixJ family response regulator